MPENNRIQPDHTSVANKTDGFSSNDSVVVMRGGQATDQKPDVSFEVKNLNFPADYLNRSYYDSVNLATSKIAKVSHEIRYDGKPLPHSFKPEDGITGLLLMSFLLFSSVYHKGLDFIRQMIQNLFEVTERDSIFVDSTTINEFRFKAFLLVQSTILLAIFTFITIYSSSDIFTHYDGKKTFTCILLSILAFFIFWGIKWIFNFFIGKIFFSQKKIIIWQNSYFSVIELLGIALFPVILFLVNSQSETLTEVCTILILFLIAISFILVVYKGFRVFLTKAYGLFYFMLYLCALEILPYMGLYMGLEYMYKLVVFNTL
ncbi:MAG: DUF4271 domain-containing protein [Candidatus Azobacteroides sp.]|nr:DUF4271 domain-containing protein [Candidatus Azobacteroides sp.]